MMRKVILAMLAAGTMPAHALAPGDPVGVPSGAAVSLIEVLPDALDDGLWLRLRFLSPAIAEPGYPFDAAVDDMLHLCRQIGLPMLENAYPSAVRIVVSLSDRMVEFGAQDAEATQFFEAFLPEDGDCIWEEF